MPVPDRGRVFRARRRVRLGDADPSGRLRLDALARYVQDVAADDTDDAGLPDGQAWVVRRAVVEQQRPARHGEVVELATFCAGYGSRWAERRVSLRGEHGAALDAATVWVHLDAASGRPKALSPEFHELYAPTASGREVLARHVHEPVTAEAVGVGAFPWSVRASDLDLFDHANNAMAWALVEELAGRADASPEGGAPELSAPVRAEVEYRSAVERTGSSTSSAALTVAHRRAGDGWELALWSADGVTAHVTARVGPLPR